MARKRKPAKVVTIANTTKESEGIKAHIYKLSFQQIIDLTELVDNKAIDLNGLDIKTLIDEKLVTVLENIKGFIEIEGCDFLELDPDEILLVFEGCKEVNKTLVKTLGFLGIGASLENNPVDSVEAVEVQKVQEVQEVQEVQKNQENLLDLVSTEAA